MAGVFDFTGCRAVIRDDGTGRTIAETPVLEYDSANVTITVDGGAFGGEPCERVSLLLLHPAALYEFKGTVRRRPSTPLVRIALYKGRPKEGRGSKRYLVDLPARADRLVVAGRLVALSKPVEARVVNLSTTGMLVRAPLYAFNVGTSFELKLAGGSGELAVVASVLRVRKLDGGDAEFGCELRAHP